MKGRTISDQDQKAVRKKLQKLIPKKLRSTRSANTISNRDVKILEEALKRNDGGMARKTRVF